MFASGAAPTPPIALPNASKLPRQAHSEDFDFERLVGREGWWRLAPDIRRRFSEKPLAGQPIRYRGVMHRVGGSLLGAFLAQLCRLIGTPFAPYRDDDVPVAITLIHDAEDGVIWEREYRYAGHAPATVRSLKRIGPDGALRECVGFGLGMRLAVFEANRALHFLSIRYFWRVAGREFCLPAWLTPGTAHVVHEDLGAGYFRFSMTIHHPLIGTLFEQDGVFTRDADQGEQP